MDTQRPERRGEPAPWIGLLGTIAWTWAFWWPAALLGRDWLEFPIPILYVLGALGPLVVPLALVARGHWDDTLGGFVLRTFDPRSLSPRWYLCTVGVALALTGLPVLVAALLFGRPMGELVTLSAPVAFLLVGALAGAVEEPGWRGYAQEALQRRMPVVAASLVIGVVWATWHLPLFFVSGTYQSTLGVGTGAFWLFFLAIIVGSPLYAWLYNAAGRVAFVALLYHALGNVFSELLAVEGAAGIEVGVEAAMALVATVAAWRWMSRRKEAMPMRETDAP
jgi:membrane protease YdiL (CAAX protease family)